MRISMPAVAFMISMLPRLLSEWAIHWNDWLQQGYHSHA
jgi:hypothetical protein